ncbi:MAG: SRPBCC family protein [Chloroflexi bacterium]|nr:MAG: SRPBCC family protein [Chloroflexota bacterium]
MTRISDEIRINAPKARVWEVVADIGAVQRYHPAVAKSWYTTEQRDGVGACRHCDLLPMGTVEERITEWNEGESYTIEIYESSKTPPFDKAVAFISLHEDGEETVVRMEITYTMKFGPLGALMDALMVRKQFSKVVPNLLAGLKHHVETGEEVDRDVFKRLRESAAV